MTELGRLLALHEEQANLLDPEKLAQIGSALVSQARIAINGAMAPKGDDAPLAGTLISSPAALPASDASAASAGGDAEDGPWLSAPHRPRHRPGTAVSSASWSSSASRSALLPATCS